LKFPYLPVTIQQPIPSQGGGQIRFRPVVAVMLTGTATPQLRDALLDTGARGLRSTADRSAPRVHASTAFFSRESHACTWRSLKTSSKCCPTHKAHAVGDRKIKGRPALPGRLFRVEPPSHGQDRCGRDASALTWYYVGAALRDGTRPPPLWNHLPFSDRPKPRSLPC
jgi:hypothetical protein